MKKHAPILASILLMSFALSAHAQFAVIDPANLAENILEVVNSLKQIDNQILQLQNEAQMLINEAKNLEHLNYNGINRLRATLATTERLFDEARGLSFQLNRAREEFARLYPEAYAATMTREQLNVDRHERWSNSLEALNTALQVQSQATQSIPEDEGVLADVVAQSQSAVGALQAAQATNQLLALHARQIMQTQQLATAQDRAETLEHARAVAAEERARELRRRFMRDETTYTAAPVELFSE